VCPPLGDIFEFGCIKWVLTILYEFLIYFMIVFGGFDPFLGDIGPFLRPDLRRKLENDNQL